MRTAAFMLLTLVAGVARADPLPSPRGDKPPPKVAVTTSAPLTGPLAPRRARDWLLILAPAFPWGSSLGTARLLAESRAATSVELAIGSGGSVTRVDLRVYGDLVAVAEAGTCCCGSCVAAIHFFSVKSDRVVDVTDAVWPRFRYITELGTAFDRLHFGLGARQIAVRDDAGTLYRLRRDRKTGRFALAWKRRDAPPPF